MLTGRPGPAAGRAAGEGGNRQRKGMVEKKGVKLIWEKENEREKKKKNGMKGQGKGVMEEQMNRDLITRPLCPKSVS